MGDGSLHAKGIRFCVADTDLDVVERLRVLGKSLFNLEPVDIAAAGLPRGHAVSRCGWRAGGKQPASRRLLPNEDHVGKGWTPRVPDGAAGDATTVEVYAAFLRGLFEADGTVVAGVPSVVDRRRQSFAAEVRTLLLALGMAYDHSRDCERLGWRAASRYGCAISTTLLHYAEHRRIHGRAARRGCSMT